MKKITFNKRIVSALAVMAAVSGATGALMSRNVDTTSAYFTDNEHHTNTYAFGDITIDGTEKNWDPDDPTDGREYDELVPNQKVSKDPRIENTGTNKAIGFIVVDSPLVANTSISGKDGKAITGRSVEMMRFLKSDGKTEGFNTTNWVLVQDQLIDDAGHVLENISIGDTTRTPDNLGNIGNATKRRRVFGYKNNIAGGTKANPTKTDPLFEYVQAQNFIEGAIPAHTNYNIDVYFLAIQADDLEIKDANGVDVITTSMDDPIPTAASSGLKYMKTTNLTQNALKQIYDIAAARVNFSNVKEADTNNNLDLNENPRQ